MLDTDNDQQENKTEQSTPPKALPSEDHSNQIVNELTNLAVQMTEAQGKIKKLKGDRKQYSFIALALILADIAIAIFRKYIFGKRNQLQGSEEIAHNMTAKLTANRRNTFTNTYTVLHTELPLEAE